MSASNPPGTFEDAYEVSGVAAVADGLSYVIVGLFVAAAGAAAGVYGGVAVLNDLAHRPGVVLLSFGAACVAKTVSTFTDPAREPRPNGARIFEIITHQFLGGMILLLIGLALLGLGLLEVFAPQALESQLKFWQKGVVVGISVHAGLPSAFDVAKKPSAVS